MPSILIRHSTLATALFALATSAAAAEPVTFAEHVAPIVFQNCTTCHRPGEAGPFSLTNYEEVRKRGAFLVAVTKAQIMPPWHAESGDYRFAGERRLSDDQIATLEAWVDAGMPLGDEAKIPELPKFAKGWQHGEPDLVLEMSDGFEVPGDGPDIYRYFVLPIDIDEARWIKAVEFRPGASEVVHHALGFLDNSGSGRKAAAEENGVGFDNYRGSRRHRVVTWAVGTGPREYPDGVAVRLEPGTDIVLQNHYHPSGRTQKDQSRVGIYFTDEPDPRNYVEVQLPREFGQYSAIDIPAGSDTYALRETFVLPVAVDAFSTLAHAHYLGKEFMLKAEFPNGDERTLLHISDYDFGWQELYDYEEFVRLPKGTRLESWVRWDNSSANPRNPYSPPQAVKWGLYSEDEMGSIILDVLPVDPSDADTLENALREHEHLSLAAFHLRGAKNTQNMGDTRYARRVAGKVLKPFDTNGDGKWTGDERTKAVAFLKSRGFDMEVDRDGVGRRATDDD